VKRPAVALGVVLACGAAGLLLALPTRAVTALPTVVAVTPDGRVLVVDARTLRRAGWSRRHTRGAWVTVSPGGSRVAIAEPGDGWVYVVDRANGRVVQIFEEGVDATLGLYWLRGERLTGRNPALLVPLSYDCDSGGCGYDFEPLAGGSYSGGPTGTPQFATLENGFVFARGPQHVQTYDGDNIKAFTLPQMPGRAPFWIVADAARDRAFLISSGGTVAEIDHPVRKPTVTYHPVTLGGLPFRAGWAGQNTIALWGQSGLRTINTNDWTVRTITPNPTDAVMTGEGIAAWTADPADGLSVYRTDGTRHFTVLSGSTVHTARAVGQFLYVNTTDARYAINLRNGKTFGPLRSDATPIGPSVGLSLQCDPNGCN
jgi:hypothetical protein